MNTLIIKSNVKGGKERDLVKRHQIAPQALLLQLKS